MKLFVEGGGDSAFLKTACRKGFRLFLERAGLQGKMPKIVACGDRHSAYDSFCTAIAHDEPAILLVDSETRIDAACQQGNDKNKWLPWQHLKTRQGDGWDKPAGATELHCHFMVQCMESWFLADRATLNSFFGQGFAENQLPPPGKPVEITARSQVYQSLANATKNCKTKSSYGKGEHSFKILERIDPLLVIAASPWASRFIDELKKNMGA